MIDENVFHAAECHIDIDVCRAAWHGDHGIQQIEGMREEGI